MKHASIQQLAVLLITGSIAGCLSKPPDQDELVKANLLQIAKAYTSILSFNHKPPKDMEALRSAVNDIHLLGLGVPADEALVSPRDKEPFVIIVGADGTDSGDPILAYERKGVDGKRWVLTMAAEVKQLNEEEFAKANFARHHKPET